MTKPKQVSPLAALADATASKKNVEKILNAKAAVAVRAAFVDAAPVNAARNRIRDELQAFLNTRFFSGFQRSKTVGKIVAKYVGSKYASLLLRCEQVWEKHEKTSTWRDRRLKSDFYKEFWDAHNES